MLPKKLHRYLESIPVDSKAFKIVYMVFFAVTFLLFSWFLYFSFVTIVTPYPIEYREGVAQVMAQILLKGGNPFSLEYQPLGMNNYGIGYYALAAPIAKLFGNSLIVHRSINFCFLLACQLLIFRTIWMLKKDILIAFLGGIFLVVALAGRGGLGAFPNTMGTFLFLATILIPFLYAFGYRSLIVSALLSVVAYYTKPYFIIGFGVVVGYTFMFISKQKGMFYTLFFLSIFSALFMAARHVFEFYFIDTYISNLSNAMLSSAHLQRQLKEMIVEFHPSIYLGCVLLFFNLPKTSFMTRPQEDFSLRLILSKLDAPLLPLPFNYFAFSFMICLLLFVYVLGLHAGNYMAYAYQILLPPFILWLFPTLNSKSWFSIIALVLLLGNILLLEKKLLNPDFLRQRDSVAWSDLYDYVETCEHVANSPVIASLLIEKGIVPVDSGQTEYYYKIEPYPGRSLIGPSYDTVVLNGRRYHSAIQNDIKKSTFDRAFTTEQYESLISADLVSPYYVQVDTLTVEMPQTHQSWVIGVWEPGEK